MRFSLMPRERRFYELFERNIEIVHSAAQLLTTLLENPAAPDTTQSRISELEHDADEVTHEIVRSINRTFVTPFDREDIYALAAGIDDIIDFIQDVSDMHTIYQLEDRSGPAVELAGLLLSATGELREAISRLESLKGLERHWIEVNRIENQGDVVSRKAIGDLFRHDGNAMLVLKLKDVYEVLEEALDRCEDVANVIENIVIKNA